MLVDGQWLVSHVNGVVNSHKPPLFFWLIALFSIPVGAVTEFTARLPSVLAALGTLWLTLRLGSRWYGAKTAALAGVILATSFMFWDKARWSQTDSLLCFLIWVSLSAFDSFRAGKSKGRSAGMLFWFAMALAVLTKGPVGLLLPLGIAVITLLIDRDLKLWTRFAPLLGPLVFAVTAGCWVGAVSLWGPADYSVLGALKEHFLERGIHGMHHLRPFWYYLERLPSSILPWTGLLPGALYLAWQHRTRKMDRMALVTCVFIFLFFSISTEKRDLYMLPAFPAWALLMANLVGVVRGWGGGISPGKPVNKKWVTVGHGMVAGLLALIAIALPMAGRKFDEVPYGMVWVIAVLLLAISGLSLVFVMRGEVVKSVLSTAVGIGAAYLFTAAVIYPAMEPVKSARSFAVRIQEITRESRSAGHPVLAWRIDNLANAFAFYSDGVYMVETRDADVLRNHLSQTDTVYAVMLASGLDDARLKDLDSLWVLGKTTLSRREILIVSNHPHEFSPIDTSPTM